MTFLFCGCISVPVADINEEHHQHKLTAWRWHNNRHIKTTKTQHLTLKGVRPRRYHFTPSSQAASRPRWKLTRSRSNCVFQHGSKNYDGKLHLPGKPTGRFLLPLSLSFSLHSPLISSEQSSIQTRTTHRHSGTVHPTVHWTLGKPTGSRQTALLLTLSLSPSLSLCALFSFLLALLPLSPLHCLLCTHSLSFSLAKIACTSEKVQPLFLEWNKRQVQLAVSSLSLSLLPPPSPTL